MKTVFTIALTVLTYIVSAQYTSVDSFQVEDLNWPNKDLENDKILGTSVDRAYAELLKDLKPKKTIIVAVIDGGVDITHEDMVGKIWVNEDEIPGNGKDDDNNGYVDDINGWNFIGGANGEHILFETLELTRIVKEGDKNDPEFERAYKAYKEMRKSKKDEREGLLRFKQIYDKARNIIREETGINVTNAEDLKLVTPKNDQVQAAVNFLANRYKIGYKHGLIEDLLDDQAKYLDYYLNKDFYPREITGDNPLTMDEIYYGNNDVTSNRSSHGTSVAGVIAALRSNGIGIDGIAENVKIMAIRSTPDGDERDKDVALAIRYAVDNGAHIINMSFGKGFSPQKEFVDEAAKYAASKGVLLVHSAGNSGQNVDEEPSYPSPVYKNGERCPNWVSVGASDRKLNKELVASFSNYGKENVTIFAPGVEIVSLDSGNTYSQSSGTSIAGPIYSGVAALVWSYFPELSAQELIHVLNETSTQIKKPKKVLVPGSEKKKEKAKFETLCSSNGVVNAYNAIKYLLQKQNETAPTP